MTHTIRNMMTSALVLLGAGILSGCATSGNAGQIADAEKSAVFGDLRLITNGVEERLGNGLFAADAGFRLTHQDTGRNLDGNIGKNGTFEAKLAPGTYRIHTIFFKHHGEIIEAETDFVFTVANNAAATYIGTISLEATLENGAHGIIGTADRFTVRNDCANVCDSRMASVGLPHGDTSVSLAHWVGQVAVNRD